MRRTPYFSILAGLLLLGGLQFERACAAQVFWLGPEKWALSTMPAEARRNARTEAKSTLFHTIQDPGNPALWEKLAVLYFTINDFLRATRAYYEVLRLQPDYPLAYTQYLQAMYLSGDVDTVRWLLKQETEIVPMELPTELLSAQLDYDAEDFLRARRHLERALTIIEEPGAANIKEAIRLMLHRTTLHNLIHLCEKLNDTEAVREYRLALIAITEPATLLIEDDH